MEKICHRVKVPYTNSCFSPWRAHFPLYHPAVLCRLRAFAMVCLSVWCRYYTTTHWSMMVFGTPVYSTVCLLYHSRRPRAGGVGGRWLGHTWSCLQGDVFLPSHPWQSDCTLLQRHGDIYTSVRAWEGGWTCKGFVGLAHVCTSSSPPVCQVASLSSAEALCIHWRESRSGEDPQSSRPRVNAGLSGLGLLLKVWSIFLVEARTSDWCRCFPLDPGRPSPLPGHGCFCGLLTSTLSSQVLETRLIQRLLPTQTKWWFPPFYELQSSWAFSPLFPSLLFHCGSAKDPRA